MIDDKIRSTWATISSRERGGMEVPAWSASSVSRRKRPSRRGGCGFPSMAKTLAVPIMSLTSVLLRRIGPGLAQASVQERKLGVGALVEGAPRVQEDA